MGKGLAVDASIELRPAPWRAVLGVCLAVTGVIVAASLLVPLATGGRVGGAYLSVDEELSLPAAWSVSLFAATSLTAALLTLLSARTERRTATGWGGVALLTALMALDEGTSIHERLARLADWIVPGHGFHFGWLVVGIPLGLLVLGAVAYLTASLPRVSRRLLLLGFLVFFSGAVGVETVSSTLLGQEVFTREDVPYRILTHLEELLEFVGTSLMLAGPVAALSWGRDEGALVLTLRGEGPASRS